MAAGSEPLAWEPIRLPDEVLSEELLRTVKSSVSSIRGESLVRKCITLYLRFSNGFQFKGGGLEVPCTSCGGWSEEARKTRQETGKFPSLCTWQDLEG